MDGNVMYQYLGMDVNEDAELLWIAEQALRTCAQGGREDRPVRRSLLLQRDDLPVDTAASDGHYSSFT